MTIIAEKPARIKPEFNEDLITATTVMDMLSIRSYHTFYSMNPAEKFCGITIGRKTKYSKKAVQTYLRPTAI